MAFVLPLVAAVAGAAASAATVAAATAGGFALFGLSVATSAAILGGVVGGIVAMGVGLIGSAIFPQRGARASSLNDITARTQQFRQPITPHRAVVGRARVSGPIVFLHTNAAARTGYTSAVNGSVAADYAANDLLYLVHVIAAHEIDAVEYVLIDNLILGSPTLSGFCAAGWGLGTADQVANAMLVAETDGKWTASHRLRGRAFLASVLKWDQSVFPSGLPNISSIIRGAEAYDPRSGATAWTNNAALVVAWYLTWPSGMRADWDEIDTDALVAAANICDELVARADGSTEKRYTCSGTFELDQAPGAILERLVSSMGGAAIYSGGKWIISAAAWVAPTANIDETWLRGDVTIRANRPARDLFNGVRAVYVRPDAGWQPMDAPPLSDAAALAADGGAESYRDLQLDFTVSGYRAQRLMQVALRRNRMQRQISAPLNMRGLALRAMDVVTFSLPRLPADTYRVVGWSLSPEGGVDVILEQDAASVYAWNPGTDERALGDVAGVEFPAGGGLDAPAVTVTTPTDPVPASLDLEWDAIAGASGYTVQWREVGTDTWTNATPTGETVTVAAGDVADFRVRAIAGDAYSTWTLVLALSSPEFTVVGTGSGYSVTCTLPTGVVKAQIFHHTTSTLASATKQTPEPVDDTPAEVTATVGVPLYVWVRSIDGHGNPGPLGGPVLVTPGTVESGGDGGGGDGSAGDSGAGDAGGDGSSD